MFWERVVRKLSYGDKELRIDSVLEWALYVMGVAPAVSAPLKKAFEGREDIVSGHSSGE